MSQQAPQSEPASQPEVITLSAGVQSFLELVVERMIEEDFQALNPEQSQCETKSQN